MEWLREAVWTWRGRLDRRRTFIMYLVACLPAYLLLVLSSMLRIGIAEYRLGGSAAIATWDLVVNLIVATAIAVPLSSVMTRRLHDIGLRAVWLLTPVVLAYAVVSLSWTRPEIRDTWIGPTLNGCLLMFAGFVLLWPGQRAENRFGPSGRKF